MMVIKAHNSKPFFHFKQYLREPVHIAPLVMLRIIFGVVMLASMLRFIYKGWVYELYIQPKFYFTYFGFDWVKPLGEWGMYALFCILIISSLFILLGAFYKMSALIFFIGFTYVELIDKSNYLNHYYFISIISFLLVLVPAHRYFSIDVLRKPDIQISHIERWCILIFQLQLAIVYLYAGIAKLNYDWLFRAMPLSIWLPAKSHLPVVGNLFDEVWVAYFFSWFGAVYDLTIAFFLLIRKTRVYAYLCVIIFHVSTAVLFQIGMFPYIMVLITLIFFSENFHKKILDKIGNLIPQMFKKLFHFEVEKRDLLYTFAAAKRRLLAGILVFHFTFQIIFPFRHIFYPGELFWTEEGFRFSWRVMLIEKAGTAFFYVEDPETGRKGEIIPSDYLTKNQEKMMATQPDMILQFVKYLEKEFKNKGIKSPLIKVESYVSLNGSGSRPFIDSNIDLTKEKENFIAKKWILPFKGN
ncbi:MAG: HTTM domain-containing protein [Bacteroidota bacterium]|nr:HTTM domain-containing protein [Bacteroidota bacterium]